CALRPAPKRIVPNPSSGYVVSANDIPKERNLQNWLLAPARHTVQESKPQERPISTSLNRVQLFHIAQNEA
ncbi:MAG: hypothetical protein Q4Q41_02240, partial [Coriobacteriia bacterium]|nr:hypothetical protein [Coriobacteriia bacterium]